MKYILSKYTLLIDENADSVILYNTFSGSIIKLKKNEYYFLKNGNFSRNNIANFDQLASQGIIVLENTNEYKRMRLKSFHLQQTDNTDNLSYVIAPTLNCNYNCKYCFENKEARIHKMNSSTADDVLNFIINQVKLHQNVKNVKVTWFGGEPLLAYELIVDFSKKLISSLCKMNINYFANMITNGSLLTDDKANALLNDCKVKTLQITLDGFAKTYAEKKQTTTQSFNIVKNNIVSFCKMFNITVRLNTDKSNYNEMCELSDYLLKECKLKNKIKVYLAEIKDYNKNGDINCYKSGEFLQIRNTFNKTLYDKNLIANYKIVRPPCYEPNFCSIIKKNNYAIGPRGELYKCEHHFGNKEKIIGDVKNGLYYNDAYFNYLEGNYDTECINCILSPCCRSDCNAMYECHKKDNKCLIYDNLLENLKKYVMKYVSLLKTK